MPNLFEKFRRQSRQFEATRGRPIAPAVTEKFLEAELRVEAERAAVNEERGERIATSREAREELKRGRAGKVVSGIGQLALTSAVIGETDLGKKVGGFAKDKIGGLIGRTPEVSTEIASSFTPALESATTTAAPGVVQAPIAAGATKAPSLLSAAAPIAGAGAAGMAGKALGEAVFGEDSDTGGVLGGAAAGALYGNIVPGIGPIAGGLAGFTTSLISTIFDW